jgi:hypothetical protein
VKWLSDLIGYLFCLYKLFGPTQVRPRLNYLSGNSFVTPNLEPITLPRFRIVGLVRKAVEPAECLPILELARAGTQRNDAVTPLEYSDSQLRGFYIGCILKRLVPDLPIDILDKLSLVLRDADGGNFNIILLPVLVEIDV